MSKYEVEESQLARSWYFGRHSADETPVDPFPQVNPGMTYLSPTADGRPRIVPESPDSNLPSVKEYGE